MEESCVKTGKMLTIAEAGEGPGLATPSLNAPRSLRRAALRGGRDTGLLAQDGQQEKPRGARGPGRAGEALSKDEVSAGAYPGPAVRTGSESVLP